MSNIIRTIKRENPFVMIDKSCLEDSNLSWKAKGLLAYLLSRPDDWKIYVNDLISRAKDGRDSVYSGLRELIEAKYIFKQRLFDEKGRFAGWEYRVYEHPQLHLSELEDEVSETGKYERTEYEKSANGKDEDAEIECEKDEYGKSISGKTVYGKPAYGKTAYGKTVYGKSDTTNNNLTNINLTNNELINNANDDEKLAKLSRFYQENFGVINPFVFDEIYYWSNELSDELVLEAMKRALRQQKKWNYAVGILKDWANRNIQTLLEVEALDVEFLNESKTKLRQRRDKNSFIKTNQVQREENWLEKIFLERQEVEEKSVDDLEERRRKLLARLKELEAKDKEKNVGTG